MAKAVIPPLLSWLALVCSVSAQLTNPVPDPLPAGLSVKLEPWLAIPARPEDTTFPNVRINHLKPAPAAPGCFATT